MKLEQHKRLAELRERSKKLVQQNQPYALGSVEPLEQTHVLLHDLIEFLNDVARPEIIR